MTASGAAPRITIEPFRVWTMRLKTEESMNQAASQEVDAIRYGATRELSAGLRHALMGELQSVQFLAELALRLLGTGAEPARMRKYMEQIAGQCTAATTTGISMIDWLRPEEGVTTTVADGVKQRIKLVGNDWALRGIEATTTDLEVPDAQIPKAQFQELTVVALLMLINRRPPPIDLEITAHGLSDGVQLSLRTRPAIREQAFLPPVVAYRVFEWRDVELLARAHAVSCSYEGDIVSLRFNAVS